MATIQDIEALGYTVGIAHGSVETEETALHNAQVEASPLYVTRQASKLTKDTLEDIGNAGRLPVSAEDKQALAEEILTAALEMVNGAATEKVEFHQRALEYAQSMADVWHIDQTVDVGDGTTSVVSVYVACKQDGTGWDEAAQEMLDALAHQPSYDERVFQAQNPDAMQAANMLALDGATVDRATGSDTFTVDGKTLDAEAVVALAEQEG